MSAPISHATSGAPSPGTAQNPITPRRWTAFAIVAVLAFLAGGGVILSALFLSGWRKSESREYSVVVWLRKDTSADQKEAVQEELEALPTASGVQKWSREQALAWFTDMWKDEPKKFAGLQAKDFPESFHFVISSDDLDCSLIREISALPGISPPIIKMKPTADAPGGEMACMK